jgi:hypothetical protein
MRKCPEVNLAGSGNYKYQATRILDVGVPLPLTHVENFEEREYQEVITINLLSIPDTAEEMLQKTMGKFIRGLSEQ